MRFRHHIRTTYPVFATFVFLTLGCAREEYKNGIETTEQRPGAQSGIIDINQPSPQLIVDSQTIDLGVVQLHNTVTTSCKLRHNQQEPVSIVRIVPSCACTDVTLSSDIIAPNGFSEIFLSVSTGSLGAHDATIQVFPSKPLAPLLINLKWYVGTYFKLSQEKVMFGLVEEGVECTGIVTLLPVPELLDAGTLPVLKKCIVSPSNELVASHSVKGDRIVVSLKLLRTSPAGSTPIRSAKVLLEFDDPVGAITIPVEWQPIDSVILRPSALSLSIVSVGEPWDRNVAIRLIRGKVNSVEVAQPALADLELSLSPDKSGTIHVMTVRGRAPSVVGAFSETIHVNVRTSEGDRLVELPFAGIVK